MAHSSLSEISRCKIPINKGETPFLTWNDSMLTLVTEKTVSIFKLSHNVNCMDKKIDWIITDILCPKTSPATSLFSKKLMKQSNIDNIDYAQMMLDPALWPHNVQLMEEMACVVSVHCSPTNFVHNQESAIAILNNVGNIELFAPTSCGYSSLINVSSVIQSSYYNEVAESIEEVKKIADALETSACCWGAQYNDMFTLVTAQRNGNIHFWRLLCTDVGTSIEELIVQQSDAGEIVAMQWIPISKDIFMLILANISGQLYAYKYQWDNKCPKLVNCGSPWPHKDRMVVKHLKYIIVDDKIVLIGNKHRHLLVLLMDDSCNKISEYLNNLNDYKITVLSESNHEFYIGTVNCKIFKANIIVMDDKLIVNVEEKILKENLVNYDLCGVGFSKNSVICALAVVQRKILFRKESVALDIIFLSEEESYGRELSILLQNPTQNLSDFWDCIELLRCKAMKLKILPSIDYNELYSNHNNIYANKLYLILLKFYHTLNSILKNESKDWLPETSLEVVKERIFALQSANNVANICRKKQNNEALTDLDAQTYLAAKKYIKYYCEKYNKHIAELVPSGFDSVEDNVEYTCQCCDENLKGFSCPNKHLNMFCGLTLTPIECYDYLICSACSLIARTELKAESQICLFCDLHLNTYCLPS